MILLILDNMAKVALNIAKAYSEGFVADIERTKYFQLHKNAAPRADLFKFAIAIGIMEEKAPTSLSTIGAVDSFVRTEYMTNCEALLSCLFFDQELKNNVELIDNICNRDEVYTLAEQYANTGFGVLKEYINTIDEELLFYKLIGYMDNKYLDIKDEVRSFL